MTAALGVVTAVFGKVTAVFCEVRAALCEMMAAFREVLAALCAEEVAALCEAMAALCEEVVARCGEIERWALATLRSKAAARQADAWRSKLARRAKSYFAVRKATLRESNTSMSMVSPARLA